MASLQTTDPIARVPTPQYPNRTKRPPGKVLLASDLSGESKSAVAFTCQRLLKDGDTLLIYHTLVPITHSFDDVFDSGDMEERQLKAAQDDAEDYADMLKKEVFKTKNINTQVKVEYGDPGTAICECAQAEGCSLIVVGSHSKSSWETLLMGSVSNYVLHHSEIPVVVVRM